MKVALAQMNVVSGQITQNLNKMKYLIAEYDFKGYDVIAFPELCISGYMVGDLWYDSDWMDQLNFAFKELLEFKRSNSIKIVVIFGSLANLPPWIDAKGQDGRPRIYNSAFMLHDSLEIISKTLLPNYRFFDDKRYFSTSDEFKVFPITTPYSHEKVTIGLEICEDVWHEDYPVNPTEELVKLGAEYIFNLSASPYSFGKYHSRNGVIQRTMNEIDHTLKNFFYVNVVGAQNNGKNIITFDGDSCIYSLEGVVASSEDHLFEETVLEFDTLENHEVLSPVYPPKEVFQYHASIAGIKHLDTLMGDKFPYIIGVSGGVDSAVVLALLVDAIGASRVKAYNLPSQYNSNATKNAAKKICDSLGVELVTIPIESVVESQVSSLEAAGIHLSDFNKENVQAKVRGTSILSNIAGALGGVMTNNGNKLEAALGYATLYGDVNGAIAPIGDLLKIEVWNLAKYINRDKEIIPLELLPDDHLNIPIPPSAELKNNQIDPMKWGYHDALLAYLLNYKRGSVNDLIAAQSTNKIEDLLIKALPEVKPYIHEIMIKYDLYNEQVFKDDLKWFLRTMEIAVFKRIQSPPIIVQSKSAFGYDHRESQLKRERHI